MIEQTEEKTMMNQHEFVAWVKTTRDHDPDETFEKAHFPISQKNGGTEVIPLHFLDHQIQGVLQSVEEGGMRFLAGNVKKALTAPGFWPPDLFDVWDAFDEVCKEKWARLWKEKVKAKVQKINRERCLEREQSGWNAKHWRGKAHVIRRIPILLTRIEDGHVFYFDSLVDAVKKFSLHQGNLSQVVNGTRRQTGGFTAVKFEE